MKRAMILFAVATFLGRCNQYNLGDRFNDAYNGEFGLRIFPAGVFSGDFITDIPANPISASCSGDSVDLANCYCTNVANSSGITQKAKMFRAWISTSSVDAMCNVQGLKERGCGVKSFSIVPYRGDAGGICAGGDGCYPIVAKDLSALIAGNLRNPPVQLGGPSWTGTSAAGTYLGTTNDTCSDWTSSNAPPESAIIGTVGVIDSQWTNFTATGCNAAAGLLCFEQP